VFGTWGKDLCKETTKLRQVAQQEVATRLSEGTIDQLFVEGDLNIFNGSLIVSLLDDFTLSENQVFNIVSIDGC
jgi:hypothetical protein